MRRAGFALTTTAALALGLAMLPGGAAAADWPQFRGPNRDGISTETGILTTWPAAGPKVLWRVPVGAGFSAVTAAGGRLYTMDSKGDDEYALAFDAATGRELWRARVGPIFRDSWGDGPRSAPTLDGDRLYALGATGTLAALKIADGAELWKVDSKARFGSELPTWGFAMTPIVVGGLVIVEVGGTTASIVALDRASGEVRWTAHRDKAGYSSPILVEVGGVPQLVFMTAGTVVGVAPRDGTVLWSVPFEPQADIKPAIPVFVAPDLVFVSASYDVGALALRLKASGGAVAVEEVWRSRVMRNHFNGSVALGPHLYGFDNSALKCVEAATGRAVWTQRSPGFGKGSLIAAAGHLVLLTEYGELLLAEASPEGYREKASVRIFDDRSWTQPTLADGRLYLRSRSELVALDLRQPQGAGRAAR